MGFWKSFFDTELKDDPQRMVDFSCVPLEGDLDKIQRGYHFCQPTYDTNYQLDGGYHVGVDFSLKGSDLDLGAPIHNILNGVCLFKGVVGANLGKIAILRHKMPNQIYLYSRYCHLKDWSEGLVVGQEYPAGEVIALMGKSGWQNGFAHLHLDLAQQSTFDWKYSTFKCMGVDWYPHAANPEYIQQFFVDPVQIIRDYTDPSNLPVFVNSNSLNCSQHSCR